MTALRALCLSGGGAHGAYELGAIEHLLGSQPLYHAYCGVSVGALNASVLAMFPSGDEDLAVQALRNLWTNVRPKDVYRQWLPFGPLMALSRPSVVNTAPFHAFVRKHIRTESVQSSGKILRVGATNLRTGNFRLFDESCDDVAGAALASSAFPGAFIPVSLGGDLYADGGLRSLTPFQSALDLGATEIDVVLCSPEKDPARVPRSMTTLGLAERAIDLMSDQIGADDFRFKLSAHEPIVSGRVKARVVRPSSTLPYGIFDMNPSHILEMREIGRGDAARLLG